MADNLLIHGGNENALRTLKDTGQYRGRVKSAYLLPPWDTQWGFEHYDAPGRASWLGMMQVHLRQVRDLLAPDGSVWLHVDDRQFADCRVLMNKVYGRSNFLSTVVVQKPARNGSRHFTVSHDYLLVFAKDASTWRPNPLPRAAESEPTFRNPDNDPRGPWRAADLSSPVLREDLRYEVVGPFGTAIQPPARRSWRFTQQRFDELDRDGRIAWSPDGRPKLKLYLSEAPDKLPSTVWSPDDVGTSFQAGQHLRGLLKDMYQPAPPPEQLLRHILTIATNPGDLVFDYFGDSGTAAAVAHKIGRHWLAVDSESRVVRDRLDKVINGNDSGGITHEVNWIGGGHYDVIAAARPDEASGPSDSGADEHVRIQVVTYRKDGSVVPALDSTERDHRSAELKVIRQRRELLQELREVVSDRSAPEATVQRIIGRNHWIFGGEYTEASERRDLLPLDQHDILLVRADRSVHVVELKKPGAALVRWHRNSLIVSNEVHEAVSQCRNYVQKMDDVGATLETIHRNTLDLEYDYLRTRGTVVVGNPDHVELPGVTQQMVARTIRSFNMDQSRVQVLTYLDLIERAEESLRFIEDDLEAPGIESAP
ncbi:Shedu anti-phage system protein SduA domain-containing protein [Streptomyces koyangensis]|uniref:Shedu anti-phage system protein SduA domain-containing protein n=1 Tax=Streptomyces koyangensis TaxID=188770 RepID=UPI003D00502E